MNMTDFVNSNYIKAEDLAANILIEAVIADVKRKEFEENGQNVVKPVVTFEDGRQVTLNQTRLAALIRAYGHNSDNWIGKTVVISRGQAQFKGKPVASVKIDPIVAPRIAASRSAPPLPPPLAAPISQGPNVTPSGGDGWSGQPPSAPPPDHYDGPDADINDLIEI